MTIMVTLAALGCGAEAVSAPRLVDPDNLVWSLVLDHHAVALSSVAPWDTISFTATPVNAAGEPLEGRARPTFTVSDNGSVVITPDGFLTALDTTTGVLVIATLTDSGVTVADTAYVNVTAAPSRPATFSIQPGPGDDATVPAPDLFGITGRKAVVARVADSAGVAVSGLPVHFTTSEHTIATVKSGSSEMGMVSAIRPGQVVIRASTTAYGVTLSDSLTLTVTNPQLAFVMTIEHTPVESTTPVLAFDPPTMYVAPGATVLFANASFSMPIDVVFDDPTNVLASPLVPSGEGNIPAFKSDSANPGTTVFIGRAFPVPGSYTYHSTLFDTHGTIVVE